MAKLAVRSNGIGKVPELWFVKDDFELDGSRADFLVDTDKIRDDFVVAEDGVSLRVGTPEEVDPPKSDDDRIDEAFPQTDSARVIFDVFFDHENRIRALESKQPITRAQMRNALKTRLPSRG